MEKCVRHGKKADKLLKRQSVLYNKISKVYTCNVKGCNE